VHSRGLTTGFREASREAFFLERRWDEFGTADGIGRRNKTVVVERTPKKPEGSPFSKFGWGARWLARGRRGRGENCSTNGSEWRHWRYRACRQGTYGSPVLPGVELEGGLSAVGGKKKIAPAVEPGGQASAAKVKAAVGCVRCHHPGWALGAAKAFMCGHNDLETRLYVPAPIDCDRYGRDVEDGSTEMSIAFAKMGEIAVREWFYAIRCRG